MAITEETKRVVSLRKAQLRSQWEQHGRELADIANRQDAIIAERAAFKASYDALEADIPEPTPSEEPV